MSLPSTSPASLPTACCPDNAAWVRSYIVSHSNPMSRYYAYIFWMVVGTTTLAISLVRALNIHRGVLGTLSNVLLLGRTKLPLPFTWLLVQLKCRGVKTPYPTYLPSSGRLLGLFSFTTLVIMLAFVGSEYLPPVEDPDSSANLSSHSWWISAGRTGIMAFALLPLCVLFSLKGSPFAVFSYKFLTQLDFDKLAWLHRWSAGLIWLLTACHVGLWTVQLAIEKHPLSGDMVFSHVWGHPPFVCGWTAFVLLTLLIVLSFNPLRTHYYEIFYASHILLVPLMLVMAALHHPNMWLWCWSALAIWVGERSWRAIRYFRMNHTIDQYRQWRYRFSQRQGLSDKYIALESVPFKPSTYVGNRIARHIRYFPPPGYAHAELVAGSTVRLIYVPRRELTWAPGQYFLINIPTISKFTTHPFTSASSYNSSVAPVLVFFIRVKNGFTRNLWNQVLELCSENVVYLETGNFSNDTRIPRSGVLLKMNVDGPFGSAGRVKWGSYAGAIIVVGGSGVSYGLGILEHICQLINQRKRKLEEAPRVSFKDAIARVNFVWVVREYGHIQWAASALRRCRMMTAPSELGISIYVTSPKFNSRPGPATDFDTEPLILTNSIRDATRSPPKKDSIVSRNTTPKAPAVLEGQIEEDLDTADLATFEGDETIELPGERTFSKIVKHESRIRRSQNQRKTVRSENTLEISNLAERTAASDSAPDATRFGVVKPFVVSKPTPAATSRISDSPNPSNHDLKDWTLSPLRYVDIGAADGLLHIPAPSSGCQFRSGLTALPVGSLTPVVHETESALKSTTGGTDAGFQLQVSESEMQDIFVVSEFARKGKPKLERILREEVYNADGPIIVACCGPASLNTMVRSSVVAQINLSCAWKESGRGQISFVSEEFDY